MNVSTLLKLQATLDRDISIEQLLLSWETRPSFSHFPLFSPFFPHCCSWIGIEKKRACFFSANRQSKVDSVKFTVNFDRTNIICMTKQRLMDWGSIPVSRTGRCYCQLIQIALPDISNLLWDSKEWRERPPQNFGQFGKDISNFQGCQAFGI